jgi:hypothetical protein
LVKSLVGVQQHPKPASLATLSLVEKKDLLFFSPHAQRLEKHFLV